MPRHEPFFKKSRTLLLVIILVPVFVAGFLTALVIQEQQIKRLQGDAESMQQQMAELQRQNTFYKQAYDVTLHDVLTLSSIYGGEQRYTQRAQELRTKELGVLFSRYNISQWPLYEVKNPAVWAEYVQRGVIRADCLPEPMLVQGVSNETFVLLTANAITPSNLSVYVDGNFITGFVVQHNESHAFSLAMADGGHELSLVASQPTVIEELYLDTMRSNASIIDYGENWDVFDCQETSSGMSLDRAGAVRILIDRQ